MQERNISLKQIYEIETVMIESIQTTLSSAVIRDILDPIHKDVFAWNVVSERAAIIEFTHVDVLRQWLSNRDRIKGQFNVNIKLKIRYDSDNERNNISRPTSATSAVQSKANETTSRITINLRRQWAIVAGHSKFGVEYKDYIRRFSYRHVSPH